MAAGLGVYVTLFDINMKRLRYVNDIVPDHVVTVFSNEYNIKKHFKTEDLIIGTVLIPGAKAPKLITKDMLKDITPSTVMVDVAVDQGGILKQQDQLTRIPPISPMM